MKQLDSCPFPLYKLRALCKPPCMLCVQQTHATKLPNELSAYLHLQINLPSIFYRLWHRLDRETKRTLWSQQCITIWRKVCEVMSIGCAPIAIFSVCVQRCPSGNFGTDSNRCLISISSDVETVHVWAEKIIRRKITCHGPEMQTQTARAPGEPDVCNWVRLFLFWREPAGSAAIVDAREAQEHSFWLMKSYTPRHSSGQRSQH